MRVRHDSPPPAAQPHAETARACGAIITACLTVQCADMRAKTIAGGIADGAGRARSARARSISRGRICRGP